jgi:hypothetical protein
VVTVAVRRRVLVVVRTVATLNRLLDVLPLISGDWRVQADFTHDADRPSPLAGGVAEALSALGAVPVPWSRARRGGYDLALAASENDHLSELDSPVLLLPHGAGHQKYFPGTTTISGLNHRRLVVGGTIVPRVIGLPHSDHRQRLGALADRAVVVGDPALARMRDNAFRIPGLRAAFGARQRRLVLIASTFGPDSVIGRRPELPERLVAGLPADDHRVAVVLHPGAWAAHGTWQVRQWLARARHAGVHVIAPQSGWHAAMLAAHVVLADHGSLALYAALLGKPVLLAGRDSAVTVPGSAAAVLAGSAPVWDPSRPVREQLGTPPDPVLAGRLRGLLVENTDVAHRLRALIYRELRLSEPAGPAAFEPVVPPPLAEVTPPALVAGGKILDDGVRVERYPDLGHGDPHPGLGHRHVVAHADTASLTQLDAATIAVTPDPPARANLMTAQRIGPSACAVRVAGRTLRLRAGAGEIDPVVLASLAWIRISTGGEMPRRDRLVLGDRVIDVVRETP